jgi:septal ring factor EnvC (AmiA/AmiB activator)
MKTVLEARRQKLLRDITRVNHRITQTQQQLARLENRIAQVAQSHRKAA